METELKTLNWQDWALIGLRCLVLLFVGVLLFTTPPSDGLPPYATNEIVIALVIGLIATIFATVVILFPTLEKAFPVLAMLGDWLIVGIFTYVSRGNTALLIPVGGLIMVASVFRLGITLGIIQSIGVIIAVIVAIGIRSGFPQVGQFITKERLSFEILVGIAVATNFWGYALQRQLRAQQRQIVEAHSSRSAQLTDMQERTRAIYDMAAALSSTLDYHKILEAALNAGWLGLRRLSDKSQGRMVSTVLLFRSSDNALHVEVARGLARSDEPRSIPGEAGIVGETLDQCIPMVFSGSVKKDPELGHFIAFQSVRSVLCIPLRAGFDNYGVMVYGSETPDAFTDEHTELLTAVGTQATVALQNAVLYQNLLRERDKIVEVEEEARKKLARDLHDGPTQSVAAIAMRMSIIYRMLERTPDDVPAELKKIEDIARNTTKEIRSMLFTLRPLVLENQGLAAALTQLAEKMQETYNQAVSVWTTPEAEAALDSHRQGTIFYIVEEAVGNARKHAQAALISVSVNRQDDVVVVNISDNGVGFDAKAAEENAKGRGGHLGMINLQERTELLGGSLRIESVLGKGSSITVLIPIKEGQENNQGRGAPKRQASGQTTKLEAAVQRMWAERSDNF